MMSCDVILHEHYVIINDIIQWAWLIMVIRLLLIMDLNFWIGWMSQRRWSCGLHNPDWTDHCWVIDHYVDHHWSLLDHWGVRWYQWCSNGWVGELPIQLGMPLWLTQRSIYSNKAVKCSAAALWPAYWAWPVSDQKLLQHNKPQQSSLGNCHYWYLADMLYSYHVMVKCVMLF